MKYRSHLIFAAALSAIISVGWLVSHPHNEKPKGRQALTVAELEIFRDLGNLGNVEVGPDGQALQLEAVRDELTIGSPNAGQGDTLYAAATKIEANFAELYDSVYTNFPSGLTLNSPIISDGTSTATAAQVVAVATDAADLRTLSGTTDGDTNLGTFTGSIITDNVTVKAAAQEIETDLEALQTVSGVAAAAVDLGTFTGSVITDNVTVKVAAQELETDLEALQTVSGVAAAATDLGTFTGDIVTDNVTTKVAIQELETDVDAIQTLSGVADAAVDLGTFTGTIITDNVTVKAAAQEIETDLEALQTAIGIAAASVNMGTFTGDIITDNLTAKAGIQEIETATIKNRYDVAVDTATLANDRHYWINAAGTVSLPSTPFNGQRVYVYDSGGTAATTAIAVNDAGATEQSRLTYTNQIQLYVYNGSAWVVAEDTHAYSGELDAQSRIGRSGGFSMTPSASQWLESSMDWSTVGTGDFTFSVDLQQADWTDVALIGRGAAGGFRASINGTQTSFVFGATAVTEAAFNTTMLTAGERYNFVVSVTRSGNALFFVNGDLKITKDVSSQSAVSFTSAVRAVGFLASTTAKVFDVRLWSTAKTAAEARAIANGYNDTTSLELHLSGDTVASGDTVWRDVSGNDRTAASNGATAIASPISDAFVSETDYVNYRKLDGGYRFDGVNDWQQLPVSLAGWDDFSMTVTFKGNDYVSSLVLLSDYGSSSDYGFTLGTHQSKVYVDIADGTTTNYVKNTCSTLLVDGQAYTVSFVRANGAVTWYINGEAAPGTPANTGSGFTGTIFSGANDLRVGRFGTASSYWDGEIYDVRIFNHALDAESIAEYSRGAATKWVDRIGTTDQLLTAPDFTGGGWAANGSSSIDTGAGTATVSGPGTDWVSLNSQPFIQGKRYRITYIIDSVTGAPDFKLYGAGYSTSSLVTTNVELENTAGTHIVEVVANASGGTPQHLAFQNTGPSSTVVLSNVQAALVGEVAHYTPSSATSTIWEDVSTLENHASNDGAELLRSELHETFVLKQDEISNKAGIGAGYYFDGLTSKVTFSQKFTGDDFTLRSEFSPTGLSASYYTLFGEDISSTNPRTIVRINNSEVYVYIHDGTVAINEKWGYTFEDGKKYCLVLSLDADAGYSVYVNGKKIASSTSTFLAFTPSGTAEIGLYGGVSNYNPFKGQIYATSLFNRALSDAEAIALSHGKVDFADLEHADGTASYASNYSAGVDGWAGLVGLNSLTGNNDAVSDGATSYNDVLTLESDASAASTHRTIKNSILTSHKRYRLKVTYYIPSGNTTTDAVTVRQSSSGAAVLQGNVIGTWTTETVEFVNDASGGLLINHSSGGTVTFNGTLGDLVHIAEFEVTPIGEVLSLKESGVGEEQWTDSSRNGFHGSLTGGVTPFGIEIREEVVAESYLKVGSIWIRDNAGTPEYSNDGGTIWNPL